MKKLLEDKDKYTAVPIVRSQQVGCKVDLPENHCGANLQASVYKILVASFCLQHACMPLCYCMGQGSGAHPKSYRMFIKPVSCCVGAHKCMHACICQQLCGYLRNHAACAHSSSYSSSIMCGSACMQSASKVESANGLPAGSAKVLDIATANAATAATALQGKLLTILGACSGFVCRTKPFLEVPVGHIRLLTCWLL